MLQIFYTCNICVFLTQLNVCIFTLVLIMHIYTHLFVQSNQYSICANQYMCQIY